MPLKLNPDELPTINLTSMIDVVFLLLIFFMVGTRFTESESSLPIDLPKVSATNASTQRPQSKTISLHRDGGIEMDSRRMTLAEMTTALHQLVRSSNQVQVYIRPDASLSVQKLMEVREAVGRSGVQQVAVQVSGQSTR